MIVLDDVLHNDQVDVDFKPIYQCIHTYIALDSLAELQQSYQADRKVCCFNFWFGLTRLSIISAGTIRAHSAHVLRPLIFTSSYPCYNWFLHSRA